MSARDSSLHRMLQRIRTVVGEWSANQKLGERGVNSGVSSFWDSVRFAAPQCLSASRKILI